MNRQNWYFEQLVTQADMDGQFSSAENADQSLQTDNGYIGIASGQDVSQIFPQDLTVDIASGVGYDQTGQRVFIPAVQNLDCSVDSNAISTAVSGGGNEKWISVFVAFDRILSDQRIDGNGVPLQYLEAESFQFIVDQAAEAAAGTPAVYTSALSGTYALIDGQTLVFSVDETPPESITLFTADFVDISNATTAEVATVISDNLDGTSAVDNGGFVEITTNMKGPSASVQIVGGTAAAAFNFPLAAAIGAGGPSRPALRPDAILLADVLLKFNTIQIFNAPDPGGVSGVIDSVTRRQFIFVVNGLSYKIREGLITEFATALAGELDNHVIGIGVQHVASSITTDNSGISANWSALVASNDVQTSLESIADDLGQSSGLPGATLVGVDGAGFNSDWGALAGSSNVQGAIDSVTTDLGSTLASRGANLVGVNNNAFQTWPELTNADNVNDAIEAVSNDLSSISGVSGADLIGFEGNNIPGAWSFLAASNAVEEAFTSVADDLGQSYGATLVGFNDIATGAQGSDVEEALRNAASLTVDNELGGEQQRRMPTLVTDFPNGGSSISGNVGYNFAVSTVGGTFSLGPAIFTPGADMSFIMTLDFLTCEDGNGDYRHLKVAYSTVVDSGAATSDTPTVLVTQDINAPDVNPGVTINGTTGAVTVTYTTAGIAGPPTFNLMCHYEIRWFNLSQ